MHRSHILLPLLLLIIVASCQPSSPTTLHRAFYHWKSTIGENVNDPLNLLGVEKLYLRVFDIDWDAAYGAPVPVGQLTNPKAIPTVKEIIPTIFITNRTFLKMEEAGIPELCSRTLTKLESSLPYWDQVQEVQLDCDWSPNTREKYFNFLALFKQQAERRISATIRLHQIRYPDQTGIPPVDRGMLMFYNMGALESWEETNSILNIEKARPYLQNKKAYPLPLDLALPIFSWGVVFRNDEMVKLIHKLPEKALQDSSRFEQVSDQRFEVKKSTYLEGLYLYRGDYIRLEKIEPEKLDEAVKLNLPLFKGKTFTQSLYHLDTTFINSMTYDHLDAVYESFF
jgi:hypothetical protein